MTRIKHEYFPGIAYLITSVTFRREKIFSDPKLAQIAHDDIAFYGRKFDLVNIAHVIMPDHIHWIIYPSESDFNRFATVERQKNGKYAGSPERFYLSKIMEDYKRHTSYMINHQLGTRGSRVWQEQFRDDGLADHQAIRSMANYVMNNPYKAGLVEKLEDYPFWSLNEDWLSGLV